jgi:hypothetical protein
MTKVRRRMLSREELAYMAGLFDGEGYIGLRQRPDNPRGKGRTTKRSFRLDMSVTSTSQLILDSFTQFGGAVHEQARALTLLRGWKNRWQWKATGDEAVTILRQLEPFLREKRVLAQLAIAYWADRKTDQGRVSDEEYALRTGYKMAMDCARAG